MKQRTIFMSVLCAIVCATSTPVTVKAVGNEAGGAVVIAEISPESKDSASDEFVALYNKSMQAIDISGWQLQYRSASHAITDEKGWTTKAIVGCESASAALCQGENQSEAVLNAGEMLLLTTKPVDASRVPSLASGMATTGGQLRLISLDANDALVTHDFVGYGTAKAYEGQAAATAPKAGQSIARIKIDDKIQDSGDNAKDFALTPSPPDTPPADDGDVSGQLPYLAPQITEIFPDPASPQTDSDDEFIELFNPFDEAIDLDGYQVVTGTGWSRTYRIQDITVGPGEYVVLTASTTHISLSNSGTGVRLLDPMGTLLLEVPSYGKAVTGSSWAQTGEGQWAWTTQPTPGAPNSIAEPQPKISATSATKKTASTAKPKAASAPKSSTKKAATSAAKNTAKAPGEGAGTGANSQPSQMNYLILAIAAAAAGGYILFEYRKDIASYMRTAWHKASGLFRQK